MNKKKLLAFLVSAAFFFVACGDNENPLFPNDPEKTISSSSSAEKNEANSSSSGKVDSESSSSVKAPESSSSSVASSSSVELPPGARVAKLEDLEKNMEISVAGVKAYLSTGSKQGFFAIRIPDTLWVVTYTDFANGEVAFKDKNVGLEYFDTPDVKKIMDKVNSEGVKLSFIVDENGKVKYAINGSKEYSEVVAAQIVLNPVNLSNAKEIKDKLYSCVVGDTTKKITFYDNSYILENVVSNKVVTWMGGHYDIQRGTLLMLPSYYNKNVFYSMYGFSVAKESNSLTNSNGESMNCSVEEKTVTYLDKSKLVGAWQGVDGKTSWEFNITADGNYKIEAVEGNKVVEHKEGFWEVFGDQLIMHTMVGFNSGYTVGIKGAVEKISSTGFTFKHSDPDKPHIPYEWSLPKYE